MNELKPCPFCGGEADLVQDRMMGSYMAVCKNCYAHSAFQVRFNNFTVEESKQRAIEAWNRRTSEWIPCGEALPPQPKENPTFDYKPIELYLVSTNESVYPFRAFWNGKFFTDGFSKQKVLAWMPLPEPYEEGEPE